MKDSLWVRAKYLLKTHKISQLELAGYIGIPPGTLLNWIYRDLIPDARTACAIVESLGVTVEFLIRGTDDINMKYRILRTQKCKSVVLEIKKLAIKINVETRKLR